MLLQLASLFTAIVSVLAAQSGVRIAVSPSPALTPTLSQGERGIVGQGAGQSERQPELSAQSSFLIDTISGQILQTHKADEARPIASITKLMTALVVLDALTPALSQGERGIGRGGGIERWSQRITFEAQDRRNGGIPYLITGEEIMVRDAWRLMLVGSSNDAAALLARVAAGSEAAFVDAMNAKARALGLKHTVFTEPTGLDAGNISSAREAAALLRFALAYPEVKDALGIRQFQFAPQGRVARIVRSTNWLVGASVAPGARAFGGKTGHIEASGYNFAFAQGNSAQELVGVILGAESNEARFKEMRGLMEWGFKNVKLKM